MKQVTSFDVTIFQEMWLFEMKGGLECEVASND